MTASKLNKSFHLLSTVVKAFNINLTNVKERKHSMETQKKVNLMQNVYAASLAETVNTYQKLNVLEQVVATKKTRQMQSAQVMIQQLEISSIEDVFLKLYSLFGCSKWIFEETQTEYIAKSEYCKLCALSKKMGGANPCDGWCLNPIKAMINIVSDAAIKDENINVQSTLLYGSCCLIRIKKQ